MKEPKANNSISSVTSEPTKQKGQKHRSSGNFSTQGAPKGTEQVQWVVTENDNFSQIEFDIMEDHNSFFDRIDPVVFSKVMNGKVTKYINSRQLYIANPKNAGGKTFIVQAWPYPDSD